MVKLRKSFMKLKVALFIILGIIVGLGGVLGIWWLNSYLGGLKGTPVITVDNKQNYKVAPPEGKTYSQLLAEGNVSGLETVGYLAYTLAQQTSYHSQSQTTSTAVIATQTTNSYKDYKDGIMLSSDFTYGFTAAGTQACFVPEGNSEGKGAGVYMRTETDRPNASTTGTSAKWGDEITYYDRDAYLVTYGEYSTEMTVYLLNEETITDWDEAVDNGDGTFTQVIRLDAPKATYYYRYAMQTRGGLDRLPEFDEITLTFTFDDDFRVLEIYADEHSQLTYIFSMSSVSKTTTTYTYDEKTFDAEHYALYENCYKPVVGTLDSVNSDDEEEEADVISVLAGAFANVINGNGQQFDATLSLGGTVYNGRLFLSVDMNALGSDVLGAIEARLSLSADSTFDGQDIYIQLKDGVVEGYYSKDFAVTADVGAFGEIIDKFSEWAQGLGKAEVQPMSAQVTAEEAGGTEDLLEQLLAGLAMEETEQGVKITLSLDDIFGIGVDAVLDFSEKDGVYTLINADISNLSYNGKPIALGVGLAPSSGDIISHDKAETPFDINAAAESLYTLLDSEQITLSLSLEGDKLADLLYALGAADLGDGLDGLQLAVNGGVDVHGITAQAQVSLVNAEGAELLDAQVYYVYNDATGKYGVAYLNLKNVLGAPVSIKVYSDIEQLAQTIQSLISSAQTEDAAAAAEGLDIGALVNGILSADFGSLIKEVKAGGNVIGATVNADGILSALGVNLSLGDISLEYVTGQDGGVLSGSVPALGLAAQICGSSQPVDFSPEGYLEAHKAIQLIQSAAEMFKGADAVNFNIGGAQLNVNGVSFNLGGKGTVGWAAGAVNYVALDLTIDLFAGGNKNSSPTDVEFVYSINDAGAYEIKIAINGSFAENKNVLVISAADIADVTAQINSIAALVDRFTGQGAGAAVAALAEEAGYEVTVAEGGMDAALTADLLKLLFGGEGLLSAMKIFGEPVISVGALEDAIRLNLLGIDFALQDNYIVFEGALKLNGNAVLEFENAKVGAGRGAEPDFSGYTVCRATEDNSLISVILDYLTGAFDSIDIGSFLGGKTYQVAVDINGDNCGIAELAGVKVDADLYFTDGITYNDGTAAKENGKLVEIHINELRVGTFVMQVSAVYMNGRIHISINKVNDIKLSEMNVSMDANDISRAVNNILALVKNPNLISIMEGVLPSGAQAATYSEEPVLTEGESFTLSALLEKLLSFDFKQYVTIQSSEDGTAVMLNLEKLLGEFNVQAPVGSAQIVADGEGGITVTASQEGKASWLSLVAERTAKRNYDSADYADYLDAGFVADFVGDVDKFIASNYAPEGEVNNLYTFTQDSLEVSLSVPVINQINVKITGLKLTAGIDENNEIVATLSGHLERTRALGLLTVVEAADIGFTYYNGYITLKRADNYRVMTAEYLMDNLLNGDNPIVPWILGMSSTVWNMFSGSLPELSSGVSDPDQVYLYGSRSEVKEEAVSVFTFINSVIVNIGGQEVTNYGIEGVSQASLSNLGLLGAQDFYMCSLNASALIPDMGRTLDVAITRDETYGIAGLKAYLALNLGGVADLSVKLDLKYNAFDGDDATVNDAVVENFFNTANGMVEGGINFNYYVENPVQAAEGAVCVFGEYDTAKGYKYTTELDADYATIYVYDFDGTLLSERNVKNGSTVYLYDFNQPETVEYEGSKFAFIYVPVNSPEEEVVYDGGAAYSETFTVTEPKEYLFKRVRTDKNVVTLTLYTQEGKLLTEYDTISGTALPADVYGGYTLVDGVWYTDKECTKPYTPEGGAIEDVTLYGKFVPSTVNVNGVIYTFINSAEGASAHYAATGYTSAVFGKDVLVLESYINGFPVTEITSGAFAMQAVNDSYPTSLVNVVVPETITRVYGRAFLDNKQLKSIVFLAESVEFNNDTSYYASRTDLGDSSAEKNYPFYGCGNGGNENLTIAAVYHNNIVNQATNTFTFKIDGSTNRVVPNFDANGWTVVESNLTLTEAIEGLSQEELLENARGFIESAFGENSLFYANNKLYVATADIPSADALNIISAGLVSYINEYTAANFGFINGYVVSVNAVKNNGIIEMTVTIEPTTRWYAFSAEYYVTSEGGQPVLNGNAGGVEAEAECSYYYGGKLYVKSGAQIFIKPNFTMYKITEVLPDVSCEITQSEEYCSFNMPDGILNVRVDFIEVEVPSVYIYSEIDYKLNSYSYNSGEEKISIDDKASLNEFGTPAAVESGYYFLGWATVNNGALEFIGGGAQPADGQTYYLIWASSAKALSLTEEMTSGSALPAETVSNVSGTDGEFYKWYTSFDWAEEVSAIGTDNTVVCARWAYNVSVSTSEATVNLNVQNPVLEGTVVEFTATTEKDKLNVEVRDSLGNVIATSGSYSFVMPAANVTITAKGEGSCVAEGTLITLADGSVKPVEELTGDELLLVWNLETGKFDYAPIVFVDSEARAENEVITLVFSDGTQVKVITEHGFWDYDLNKYVYLDKYAAQYIGHTFGKQSYDAEGNMVHVKVELTDVIISVEETTAWSPVTYGHLCYYVNGMLSMPGGISGLFNIFEVNPETMQYDEAAMAADIEEYGLFTYEDFDGLIPEAAFEAFNGKYLKIAIGKGLLTWDDIVVLAQTYAKYF